MSKSNFATIAVFGLPVANAKGNLLVKGKVAGKGVGDFVAFNHFVLLLFGCDVRIIKQLKLLCKYYCNLFISRLKCAYCNYGKAMKTIDAVQHFGGRRELAEAGPDYTV